jgi:hypothetical protein
MANRVAGVCYIKADGAQFDVSGGVETPLSSVTRETVMGLAGPAGFKEVAQKPYVKLTAVFTPDFPIQTLTTSTNMTVTAELANGKVYILTGAFLEGEPAANGEDGTTELEFGGSQGVWQ